jgi:hypothetical protein
MPRRRTRAALVALALVHACATAVALPLVVAASFAIGQLGTVAAILAGTPTAVVLVGAPFAIPLLHFHWQPADRKSAALAFATGLPSLALGYTLCISVSVWLWSIGTAPM